MVAPPNGITRVLVVVIDGVRADAIPLFGMPHLERLMARGAWTLAGTTVAPSVTAAAMGSLLTGVDPGVHGLNGDRFHWPRPRGPLDPMPRVLARSGLPTQAHMARVPRAYRRLATTFAQYLGISHATLTGNTASEIVAAYASAGQVHAPGLHLHHWPDADRAGHAEGWTSRRYANALRDLDNALGLLDDVAGATTSPGTLLIVLSDHGGGGREFRNHDSDHPHDRRIPIVLAGLPVRRGRLAAGRSLLDVSATVAWSLGVEVPERWHGVPMHEAFVPAPEVEAPELALAC